MSRLKEHIFWSLARAVWGHYSEVVLCEAVHENCVYFFRFQELGLEKGWGGTAGRVLDTIKLLQDLLQAPDPETLEKFLGRIPMIFSVVIVSPHGYFGQAGVLGLPDTGGQVTHQTVRQYFQFQDTVGILLFWHASISCFHSKLWNIDVWWSGYQIVYILDQVRALESEMLDNLQQQGLDIKPQIVVVSSFLWIYSPVVKDFKLVCYLQGCLLLAWTIQNMCYLVFLQLFVASGTRDLWLLEECPYWFLKSWHVCELSGSSRVSFQILMELHAASTSRKLVTLSIVESYVFPSATKVKYWETGSQDSMSIPTWRPLPRSVGTWGWKCGLEERMLPFQGPSWITCCIILIVENA